MFWYFASSMRREGGRLPLREACMSKKRPDKQQNLESRLARRGAICRSLHPWMTRPLHVGRVRL